MCVDCQTVDAAIEKHGSEYQKRIEDLFHKYMNTKNDDEAKKIVEEFNKVQEEYCAFLEVLVDLYY